MSGKPPPGHKVWAAVVQAPEGIVGLWLFVLLQLKFKYVVSHDMPVTAELKLGGYV